MRVRVPDALAIDLPGLVITDVSRRGKYLLLETAKGVVMIHLGMSGSLRVTASDAIVEKHDHIDIVFEHGECLRLRDPRRFGLMLWVCDDVMAHPLLNRLGPEPLTDAFNGDVLYQQSRGKTQAIKLFIMDAHRVVGVGNIYASETLFRAGIHPLRAVNRVSLKRYQCLANEIKRVLSEAITQGGTTLRDFRNGDDQPGYFSQQLNVYGRGGDDCVVCGKAIRMIRQGQRATYYCPQCQR